MSQTTVQSDVATRVPLRVPRVTVVERGSFAHAACTSCGWRGPGRRAREAGRRDGELHALAGCGL